MKSSSNFKVIPGVLKYWLLIVFTIVIFNTNSCVNSVNNPEKWKQNFDADWKFHLGDVVGAELPEFNDSLWRTLDLPHDWSIEDLPLNSGKNQIGPFAENSIGGTATGFVVGGTAWYRKSFIINNIADLNKVQIIFDGVYMESEVWINGNYLGYHPYGYTPFYYDLSKYLFKNGEKNTIAVKVKNEGKNSRWYSGSGIYRHVDLVLSKSTYIPVWGIFVTTPEVSNEKAKVNLEIQIENETGQHGKLTVVTKIFTPDGEEINESKTQISPLPVSYTKLDHKFEIVDPLLWSPETPNLYKAVCEVRYKGIITDVKTTYFGIRSIEFSAQKGFLLNGEPLLLKGGCMHHDNGPLGAAAIDRAEERRVELMKKFGFNAIRTSHNPPSEVFLDACDRLGILVINESFDQWQLPKNPDDYHRFFDKYHKKDVEAMVLRDRNHPSVIMWSIGNEIRERVDSSGIAITENLRNIIRNIDSTRPVTSALCDFWDNKGKIWEATIPAFALLDIGGYNYKMDEYEKDHAQFPERIMLGTESYPNKAFENWRLVEKHPYIIGDFVWTSMDYLGEAGIGNALILKEKAWVFSPGWPWYNAFCGDIDICGFKKPQSYYRDVLWKISNLEMAVHAPIPSGMIENVSYWGWPDEQQSWNWKGLEGKSMSVNVYSNFPEVRLELNGKIIGTKSVSDETKLTAVFDVPYELGELKAVAIKDGKDVETKILKTSGNPYKIRLTADRLNINANRNDLSYITVEVLDENGILISDSENKIRFEIEGNGTIAAVENGNPKDVKSFSQAECNVYKGKCIVIIRPSKVPGKINLKAISEGLEFSEIEITTI